ncbi:MAG: spirocyclase AveC family protein [Nevskia sp.]|nr:spirocyclase AveC family protein [Nevskia sp.]
MPELSPIAKAALNSSYACAFLLVVVGLVLSFRRGRPHPLLLVCISALSISWIEAPYDWAVYAQFPPALPRMPSWWPLNMTWGGGLPRAVPPGYIAYFVFPAVISVALARWLNASFQWRAPVTLLTVGLAVGSLWAFVNNAIIGAQLGVWRYGRVIEGLALWPGTTHQYPLYDALAMGVQMMVITYVLGRTDSVGRTFIEAWADSKSKGRLRSSLLSIAAVIVIGHVIYLSVFAPHLATKLLHLQTVAPTEQLYEGVPNQPL